MSKSKPQLIVSQCLSVRMFYTLNYLGVPSLLSVLVKYTTCFTRYRNSSTKNYAFKSDLHFFGTFLNTVSYYGNEVSAVDRFRIILIYVKDDS
jgi:hypothetical protein